MTYTNYSTCLDGVNSMLNRMIAYMEEKNDTKNPIYKKLCTIRQLEDEVRDNDIEDGFNIFDLERLLCDKEPVMPKDSVRLSDDGWYDHLMQAYTDMTDAYRLQNHFERLSYHARTLENDLRTWWSGNISVPLVERWIKDIQNADKALQKERVDAMETISKYTLQRTETICASTRATGEYLIRTSEFTEKMLSRASNHLVMAEHLLRKALDDLKKPKEDADNVQS